jgi:dTDP-glucose 4,6-dehydratase/UDP-glucuronate decarboxylase
MKAAPIVFEDCREVVAEIGERLSPLAGKTVLITGANGFLMSYIVDVIAVWNDKGGHAPAHIVAIDNMITGRAERLAHLVGRDDLTLLSHDITEPLKLDRKIDFIVHGASIASPMVYRQYPLETIDANVGGTRNMLELARANRVEGMLVMSTSEIYGDPDPAFIPTPESYRGNVSCTGPRACYDESKRMSETLAVTYNQLYKLPIVMIRPFNVFGPGFRLDDQRVLPDFMTAVLNRRNITMLSDGRPTRTFCYVTDAVRAMLLLLVSGKGGEPYNVGNEEGEISMADLARLVAKVGSDVMGGDTVSVETGESDDPAYLVDNPQRRCPNLAKLRKDVDWAPKVPLAEGLRRSLVSYRQLGFGVG